MLCGIDLGSTGIRAMVVDPEEKILVSIQESIPRALLYKGCEMDQPKWHEQNPDSWKREIQEIFVKIGSELKNLGYNLGDIQAICSDSTSGTIIPVDESGEPLHSAMMYNDIRAEKEAKTVQKFAEEFNKKVGYTFQASFSLPKILWIKNNLSATYNQTYKFLHANDLLVGILSGEYFHSDSSNCLKAGFDFVENRWPNFIPENLGIPIEKLPEVVPPGKLVGKTSKNFESITGLPEGVAILGGATDSIMALIASGASDYGDVFSSLGTTLVTRVLSQNLIRDPQGRVYCHLYPGKRRIYLPGGASSVGADCLQAYFPKVNYAEYDQKSLAYFPTEAITYPLTKKGERFPFVNGNAEHFYQGPKENHFQQYAAYLQAIAFVERLSIEVLENLGVPIGKNVYTIGGATKSSLWLQIRADVLQKTIYRPKVVEAAYGAAILAASNVYYKEDLTAAVKQFVQSDLLLQPRVELREKIERRYKEFLKIIQEKFQIQIVG